MNSIQAPASSTPTSPSSLRPSVSDEEQLQATFPTSTNQFGIQISAEAQYLFEIDKYMSALDQSAQDKALDYLSNSDDVPQNKAAEYFIKSQEYLNRVVGEDRAITLDRTGSEQAGKLLDVEFEINGTTEIAVMPMATPVFRLDGNDNFHPIRLNYRNNALNHQLDALEKTAHHTLGNQDAANLFGSVRDALSASENILLSFDDVLHFNHSVEKARVAIDFIGAPESLTSALSELLNQGVDYQNDKQSRFLEETKTFLNDSRVSQVASEDILMGTAAKLYNNQLQRSLDATGTSILDAQGAATALLIEHTDLVRFSSEKLDEAFDFYKKDLNTFEKALNNEFGVPVESAGRETDGSVLDLGRNYAERLIEDINSYLIE